MERTPLYHLSSDVFAYISDVTDPHSAGFTSRVHNGPRDHVFPSRFGFTLKPVSAVSSRDYWAGPVLES